MKALSLLAAASLLLLPHVADARTKLVTLPDRTLLVTSLENLNHTLLYEERDIPLQQGTNFIDFSWVGVNIDTNSVMIELLSNPDTTNIISTGFPPNENALTWQVYSPEARIERVRVSYLLRGITTQTSYEMRVNAEETEGDFQQYVLLRNASGENLENAILRMRSMEDVTRSIEQGEARRFLAIRQKNLPLDKLYVAKPGYQIFKGEDGETISMVYEIENKEETGLGGAKLPQGKVRLYIDDGLGSSIFLGEDMMENTAPEESAELKLGTVKDVTLKRRLMSETRQNEQRNSRRETVLFDLERHLRYEIENFKEEPVTLKIHEPMNGDWEIVEISNGAVETERKSISELIISVDLPPAGDDGAEKKVVDLRLVIKRVFPHER